MSVSAETKLMLGGIVAVTLAAMYMAKKASPAQIGAAVGSTVVGAAAGAATGAVVGIGNAVGIPATDQTACQQAMAAGKTWEASLYCPAADFLRYLSGASAPAPATAGASEWGSFDTGSGGNTW